jgi:hypothetical protein
MDLIYFIEEINNNKSILINGRNSMLQRITIKRGYLSVSILIWRRRL